MIHVKKDNHCSNLAAAPRYMFRLIPIVENWNLNCYMIYVKKDNCCSKIAAAT